MSPDEELRLVRRREGTHRPASKKNPGYDRDLLRDNDGNLLGPTESRPVSIEEIVRSHTPAVPPRPTAGQVLFEVVMDAAEPHIRRGVDTAVDAAVRGGSKLCEWVASKAAQRRGEVSNQSTSGSTQVEAVPATAETEDEAGTLLEVRMHSVTTEQYQAALHSAHRAEQYAAHMRQLLAKVAVRDDDLPAESAIQAAESPASSIDEATLRPVAELLDSSRTVDGEFELVRNQDTDAPGRSTSPHGHQRDSSGFCVDLAP